MEGEKILMAVGATAAVVTAAFVFWGPTGATRLRQRRGQIAGLHNFGRTCFLNTLLQAMAACPQFIAWLQLYGSSDKKSLIGSLLNTLEVINGTHPTLRADPYSPGAVLRALHALGWVIPPNDEHDAHELLHVMLASLEEEAIRPKRIGCLSDALGDGTIDVGSLLPPPRPSSALLSDFTRIDYDEATGLVRNIRSEVHTPDSPQSGANSDLDDELPDNTMLDNIMASPKMVIPNMRESRSRSIQSNQNGDVGSKRGSLTYRSLERLNRGPNRVSVYGEKAQIQIPHPFRGAQSSQMICSGCGYKSVVRYDKFDSISLPLPEIKNPGLSLGHLLSDFVSSENLTDVTCESCNETCNHTKSVTFAKLPACLCIHISRNTWLPTGQLLKRKDFVHFPESLSMAPYSFIQPSLSQASTPWGSTMSLLSSSLQLNTVGLSGNDSYSNYNFGGMFPRNLYRLLAVVVHTGEANGGHFITYRRGALRNSHRWYYTSDTVVKEVSIDEVLNVSAYLLFYDRGTGSKQPQS